MRRRPRQGDVPVQVLTSGPDSQWAGIRQLYFAMIVSAQRHVYLQSPYFIPDATIAEALKSAARSGVDVKVMLTARASGDPGPRLCGQHIHPRRVSAGVRVFLYEKGYLHAKTISINSEICSIGSANIDIRSFSINYEINAVLYSRQLARELEEAFERDLADCTEFDPVEYSRKNPAARFRTRWRACSLRCSSWAYQRGHGYDDLSMRQLALDVRVVKRLRRDVNARLDVRT